MEKHVLCQQAVRISMTNFFPALVLYTVYILKDVVPANKIMRSCLSCPIFRNFLLNLQIDYCATDERV